MKKVWLVKFVAGNPEIFFNVRTEMGSPYLKSKALEIAENMVKLNPTWRIFVEHTDTKERIFESNAEKQFSEA